MAPNRQPESEARPYTPNDYSPTYWITGEGALVRVSKLPPEFDDGTDVEITEAHRARAQKLFDGSRG